MATIESFEEEFYKHAVNGYIGDPEGEDAYAYMRVSSTGQADELRSGLPRQVENIHIKGLEENLRIHISMVFADDYTGFDSVHERPELNKLLQEIKKKNSRRGNVVIIEKYDRLARTADDVGWIRSEFKHYGVSILSKMDTGNAIIDNLTSTVNEKGMIEQKERMRKGTLKKMQDGRITSKVPAYGYQFVDSSGDPNGKNVKRDTHYGKVEPQASVVRMMYERIAEGASLHMVANELNGVYLTPKGLPIWDAQVIFRIIKNEVYKGTWIGNRTKSVKVEKTKTKGRLVNGKPNMKFIQVENPREDWNIVPVPPIVTEDLWERANDMLHKNSTMSSRNAKNQFLLTGLVKCATCGSTYSGSTVKKHNVEHGKIFVGSIYRCASVTRPKAIKEALNCTQGVISGNRLETAVWDIVSNILLDPTPILEALDQVFYSNENENTNSQLKYLKDQLEACDIQDAKIKKGYIAGVYSEEEALEERNIIREKKFNLRKKIEDIQTKIMSIEQYQQQRKEILAQSKAFREKGNGKNKMPFEKKRTLIKSAVDKIVLNTHTQTLEIYGRINGIFQLNDEIASHSANRVLYNYEWLVQSQLDESTGISLSIVSDLVSIM